MSKSYALVLVLVFLTASSLVAPLPVKADTRTIVVPDDYPTISSAIGNATAGDTIFVKKGTYEEKTLEISKTLSLIGEGAESTKINLDPPLYTVVVDILGRTSSFLDPSITVEANDFKLSGFTINLHNTNYPGGSILITGNRTQITGNNIATLLSFKGSYSNISENTFLGGIWANGSYCKISANSIVVSVRDSVSGITVSGSYFDISANNIEGSWFGTGGGDGIHVEGSFCLICSNNITTDGFRSVFVSGDNNTVAKNLVAHSDFGIAIGGGSNNSIYANRITDSGIGLSESGRSNIVYANYVANNLWGIDTGYNSVTAVLYHNNFISNTYQVSTIYNVYPTDYFDNGKEGNYWSDYHGEDANGDGIGDTPYVIDDNRSDRFPLMAPYNIDSVPVELPEWASPPSVRLISPKNSTYTSANITLEFTVNKQTSWMGYSLDGQDNVTVTGNMTLPNLSYGSHNVTVYATDMVGRNGASETIYFSVAEPFPTALVVAVAIIACVFGFGLILNLVKAKRKSNNRQSNQKT